MEFSNMFFIVIFFVFNSCFVATYSICDKKCQNVEQTPWFTIHGQLIKSGVLACTISQEADTKCRIDISDLLISGDLNETGGIETIHSFVFNCVNTGLELEFVENDEVIANTDIIAYLAIKKCHVSWKTIGIFGNYVDLLVLYLDETTPVDETEENIGIDVQLQSEKQLTDYTQGLRNIGTISVVCADNSNTSVISSMNNYVWPNMAEMQLINCLHEQNSDIQKLKLTMENLQAVQYENCGLEEVPSFFPWSKGVYRLPRNLSRSVEFQRQYVLFTGARLEPNIYIRTLVLGNNNIGLNNDSCLEFKGYLFSISLVKNNISNICGTTFVSVTGLQVLDLSHNYISRLEKGYLEPLTEVYKIKLEYSNIEFISVDSFTANTQLEELYLRGNNIQWVHHDTFAHLPHLTHLDLSYNHIESFTVSEMHQPWHKISTLLLNNNNLASIPVTVFHTPSLRLTNLSNNVITSELLISSIEKINSEHLGWRNIINTHKDIKRSIILNRNNISEIKIQSITKEINKNIFYTIFALFSIELHDTGLKCDCDLYQFYATFKDHNLSACVCHSTAETVTIIPDLEGIQCQFPNHLNGLKITNLNPTDFQCSANSDEDCPMPCNCLKVATNGYIIVNCSGLNLSQMPDRVPRQTKELYLEHNHITKLRKAYPYFRGLNVLSLYNNSLGKLGKDVFHVILSNIEKVLLNGNRLTKLPRVENEFIRTSQLYLGSNLWICNCHSKWIKVWLKSNTFIIKDMENIFCASGESAGSPIIYTPDEQFICTEEVDTLKIIIPFVSILVAIIIISVLIFIFRKHIQLCFYIKCGWVLPCSTSDQDINVEEYKYDIFVTYARENYPWVIYDLLPKLEGHDPPYKVCIHDRDFEIGGAIVDNIVHSIKASRRMILVLTNSYLKSSWCMYEFRMAHNRVFESNPDFLKIILYEDILDENMDADMQLYIDTKTYLTLTNNWFWDRLLYTMPRPPLRSFPNYKENENELRLPTLRRPMGHVNEAYDTSVDISDNLLIFEQEAETNLSEISINL